LVENASKERTVTSSGSQGAGPQGAGAQASKREAALVHVRTLLSQLKAWDTPTRAQVVDLGEHLERAVTAFHLEAIRFRMFSLDRALKAASAPADIVVTFDAIRADLEAAGFSTRSHA
jgi:hypothetical protein